MAFFSFLATAISGALFAGSTLAASVIAGGLAFAARIGLSYLNRPKKRAYSAVQGETQFGGDIPVSTIFGTAKTKGQRTFYGKWGKGNKFNAEVFLLANGWCDGLEPYVYFYGQKFTLVEREIIGNEVAHYGVEGFLAGGDHLFSIRFYDGRPGQPVDQKLVDDTADLGQTWKSTSVNAGIAYVIVERLYNGDKFDKGKPDIEFVLRGLREYDPRKDSSIAGGSGPQRLDDPATWVHTLNPAVHRFNYQLGLRAQISGRTLIGEGKSIGQIDLATYFVAMNVCDTLRTDDKRTYQCSLIVGGEDDHTEILREFDDAMAGYGLNRRGLSGIIAGAPQIPVMEINEDDIPSDRAKEVQYRKSAFDRYNHMSGQFTSIEAMWNPESLKPIYVNLDVAEDGRIRQVSNDFLQVTDADIAQYLLSIRYRQNRKGGTATLPVSRRVGMKVLEGEWVTWRGKTWMISQWSLDERFCVTLKLSETGADIYDDEDIEPGPIVIPPTVPLNPSLLSTVQNFGVQVGSLTGADGTEYPTLRFTWTPPEDPSIISVRFEYFDGTDPTGKTIQKWRCDDPESGEDETGTNIVPGSSYSARATIVTRPDRLKTWTPWKTTAATTIPVYLPGMIEEIQQSLNQFHEWLGSGTRDLILQLRKNVLLDIDVDVTNYTDIQRVRQEVTSTAQGVSAKATAELLAATGPGSALAQSITALEATVNNPTGGVLATSKALNVLTTRVATAEGNISAVAQSVTALSAVVDGKASTSALNALTTRVTTTEGNISAVSQDLTNLGVVVNGKASTTALSALTTRVTTAEGRIDSVSQDLTDLGVVVNGKASSTALGALTTRVTTAEGKITANSDALTALDSTVGKFSASGKFRVSTEATPAGATARIGLSVSATNGGTTATAALFLDALSDGTSRCIIQAAKFAVVNGSSVVNPFIVSGGIVRMNIAHIGAITAGTLEGGNGKMKIDLDAGTFEVWS